MTHMYGKLMTTMTTTDISIKVNCHVSNGSCL